MKNNEDSREENGVTENLAYPRILLTLVLSTWLFFRFYLLGGTNRK